MKKSMATLKKAAVFFLASSLAITILPTNAILGASGKYSNLNLPSPTYKVKSSVPAWKLDKTPKTTLKWFVDATWWDTSYGKDFITKQIQKDLKLNISFTEGDDTKLNAIMASGTTPDLITTFTKSSAVYQKAPSWALPLNALADKYDPYFYKVYNKQTFGWFKMSNGLTYGYPSYSNTAKDYKNGTIYGPEAFAIRKDVYNALGKPKISAPQQFLSTLKKIKAKYPKLVPFGFGAGDKNGAGDMGGSFQDYLGVNLVAGKNKFYNRFLDPQYLSWLKVMSQAYRAGEISDDLFAQTNTQHQDNVQNGKYAIVFATSIPNNGGYNAWKISHPSCAYIPIQGPANAKGNKPKLNQAGLDGWSITFISKKCSNPQKAIELYTYLLSPMGQYLVNFGVKGVTYNLNKNGKAYLLPAVQKLNDTNPTEYGKKYRFGNFWFFTTDGFINSHKVVDTTTGSYPLESWAQKYLYPHFVIADISPDLGTPAARNETNINSYEATFVANAMRAKSDTIFNNTVKTFKAYLKNNGWNSIVKIYDQKIAQNVAKLKSIK